MEVPMEHHAEVTLRDGSKVQVVIRQFTDARKGAVIQGLFGCRAYDAETKAAYHLREGEFESLLMSRSRFDAQAWVEAELKRLLEEARRQPAAG
jgi:hypothetical protein